MEEERRRSIGALNLSAEACQAPARSTQQTGRVIGAIQPSPRLLSFLKSLSEAAGTAVLVGAGLALVAEVFAFSKLQALLPIWAIMRANSSLAFILAGASLKLWQKEPAKERLRNAARACGVLVGLLGLLGVAAKVFGWELSFIHVLFHLRGIDSAHVAPQRMAILTAINFLLIGCALALLDSETRRGRRPAEFFTLGAALISLLGLLDDTLYPAASYTGMSLPTALLFCALCIGVLLARPDRGLVAILSADSLGGTTARRLLPAAIGVTLAVGWLRYEGERAGLYGSELGVALFAAATVLGLTVLFWWNAVSLDRIEGERRQAEQAMRSAYEEIESRVAERTADLAKANADLRIEAAERGRAQETASHLAAIVQSSNDAIVGLTLDWVIVSWNAGAERIYGYTAAEAIGKHVSAFIPPERAEEVKQMEEWLERGERVEYFETVRLGKDGERLHVSTTVSPVKDAAGKTIGASTIARDISGRKRAEEALRQANSVLTGWLRELEKRTHETTLLNEMGDLLQTCVATEEAYVVIARFVQQLFPADSGAVCVLNSSRNLVEAVAHWGEPQGGERVFGPEECWGLRRGQAHVVNHCASELLCRHLAEPWPASYLCAPMMGQGEALGVLHLRCNSLTSDPGSGLTESKQHLALTTARQLGLALANLRLRDTLRIQSIRDPLTGLYNRRYMEESLERELHRAARSQHKLGTIMLDLDHFKRFNDTFGHEAGDALLRELGDFLRSHTRQEDIACRYGGEEFVLILPEASVEVTRRRAEHLREEFKQVSVRHRGQSLGSVSFSIGMAFFPEHGSTADEILRAADRALYRAKAAGRDRVALAEVVG